MVEDDWPRVRTIKKKSACGSDSVIEDVCQIRMKIREVSIDLFEIPGRQA
jgi:hypothetical protein